MKIILIGYMASGKSEIGKALAEVLRCKFFDLDQYIEVKEKSSIHEIFDKKGEVYFRKLEHNYLNELLKLSSNIVLALGGGTPCYGNNLDIIKKDNETITIYLKASINELVNRLNLVKESRPLVSHLKTKEELTEFVAKHLFERSVFYDQSDVIEKVDGKLVKEIVRNIVVKLYQ